MAGESQKPKEGGKAQSTSLEEGRARAKSARRQENLGGRGDGSARNQEQAVSRGKEGREEDLGGISTVKGYEGAFSWFYTTRATLD